jgi:hypothetical protein
MSRLEAPLATLGQSEVIEAEAELALPPGTTSVEFLSAVYRDAGQPMHRRLRAAIECGALLPSKAFSSCYGWRKGFRRSARTSH